MKTYLWVKIPSQNMQSLPSFENMTCDLPGGTLISDCVFYQSTLVFLTSSGYFACVM